MEKKDKLRCMRNIEIGFRYSDMHKEAMSKAVSGIKGIRGGKRYHCRNCKESFSSNYVQVDHLLPVVPLTVRKHDLHIVQFIGRLFCKEALQVLCKDCHKAKSRRENRQRKANLK